MITSCRRTILRLERGTQQGLDRGWAIKSLSRSIKAAAVLPTGHRGRRRTRSAGSRADPRLHGRLAIRGWQYLDALCARKSDDSLIATAIADGDRRTDVAGIFSGYPRSA
jgi:hypothetical protein